MPECDGVYRPGGYLKLYAEELAGGPALDALAVRAADGLPVLGEYGGFMALAETRTTADGDSQEMAGVLPADVEMHDHYQALDYVELHARVDGPTAAAGDARCTATSFTTPVLMRRTPGLCSTPNAVTVSKTVWRAPGVRNARDVPTSIPHVEPSIRS